MTEKIKHFLIAERKFLYSLLPLVIVFLLTRLPYYLYYPVTGISFDTPSYIAVAFDMLDFKLPLFEVRTPGYPFFLFVVWSISKTIFSVSLIQSIITLLTSVFFLFVLNMFYKKYIFLFAAAVSVYISSAHYLILDTALLTESLFVNLIIITCAFLILSVKRNKPFYWTLFSLSAAAVIIVRPAGIFLCGIILVILLYLLFRKSGLKYYLSVTAPISLILLSLCFYNYITLGSFTVTPFGESNMSGVVITFMEPSPEYPGYINEAVEEVLSTVPKKDIRYVKTSYGVTKLYDIFLTNYVKVINLVDNVKKRNTADNYTVIQRQIRKVYIDAIKNYPMVYLKFFSVNLYRFFTNIRRPENYTAQLEKTYRKVAVDSVFYKRIDQGGWQQISSDESDYEAIKSFYLDDIRRQKNLEYITINPDNSAELRPTILKSVYEIYEFVYNKVFRNIIWLFIFATAFTVSIYKLFKSRISDSDALIFFILCLMFISKAVMVSMVEMSLERYSYTVEFVFYLSLPFLIIMLKDFKKLIKEKKTI
ncbi:MAG: hypothetical protein JNJ56_07085 [Ignavibacteria bacterium]|nr:hypothetical protein [Ignavibacteria bacterium]